MVVLLQIDHMISIKIQEENSDKINLDISEIHTKLNSHSSGNYAPLCRTMALSIKLHRYYSYNVL